MERQQGRPPTEEEMFYINWGRETVKNNITLCNDILKQLITLSSALLGVTIIFEKIVSEEVFKAFVLLSFFTSLVVAFLGVLPFENNVNIDTPEEIKAHKQKALAHKRRYLWISATCLVLGFGIIVGKLMFNIISR